MAFWFEVTLPAMDVSLILPILTMCIKDVRFEKDLKSKWTPSGTTYFAPTGEEEIKLRF